MFSLEVVDTDAFLDMPSSAQLLYFHLSVRADDDGFIANPKRIMRMIGSNEDDLKVLIAKKFIIPFDDGVCVIKHWRINNFIRKDIYKETKYLDLKRSLFIRANGAYTLSDNGDAIPLPAGHFNLDDVNATLTQRQLSIDKNREDKVRVDKSRVEKKTHGEFKNVYLSDDEYAKLVGALNENAVTGLIAELDTYIESSGKRYKSHYATIQNWARRRVNEYAKEKLSAKPKMI